MPNLTDPIAQYRDLRQRTDGRSHSLSEMHCRHLACKPGCHDCCTDLTVFPVEYHAILDDMRRAGVTSLTLDEHAACPFLSEHGLCTIYRFRPLICRTHGLPIAYTQYDVLDTPETAVSFCPKNFTDPDCPDFGPHNTLALDPLNDRLNAINDGFASATYTRSPRRIPLRQLAADLAAG